MYFNIIKYVLELMKMYLLETPTCIIINQQKAT